jgi:lysophospholipase L1-like esterase
MTTLNEMIEIIKAENPQGLRTGTDDMGYTDLSPTEYEAQIAEWANNRVAKEAKTAADLAQAEAVAIAKAEAATKLTALGIDPKALGL